MKGYVIFDATQAVDLSRFLAKAESCEFIPVNQIKCESLLFSGGSKNVFNINKAEEILHRPIKIEEIARTLSHIECWHKIAEDESLTDNEFAVVTEAELMLTENYYSALLRFTEQFIHSPRNLILLSRSVQDDYWSKNIYKGEGELSGVIFNSPYYYHNAYCQMYLMRKSLAKHWIKKLESQKPYWLAHRFADFCDLQQLSQISPLIAQPKQWIAPHQICVKSIDETLDFILQNSSSVMRFGDGEFFIMNGYSIGYQDCHPQLVKKLKQIAQAESSEKRVVCLPDIFNDLSSYNTFAYQFWNGHLTRYRSTYESICTAPWYGCAFISRPYIDWQDKSHSARWFQKLKQLWQDKDILIVEGETSRSGVGNDLFDNAKSIQRIICPSKNAYDKVEEIQQAIEKHAENRLILLMLGPTAKVLAWNLSELGYQAIDIGHIDSEYEWFKMGATEKVKLGHKHTAEFNGDEDLLLVADEGYEKQIVARVI